MSPAAAQLPALRITLGHDRSGTFDVGLPVIAGARVEALFEDAQPAGHEGAFSLFQSGGWLVGAASVPATPDLDAMTRRLYEEIFRAARGRHLLRVWNYVPAINEDGPDGLENYQAFCRGRSLMFEQALGPDFKAHLPASSAVGAKDSQLSIVFAASVARPRHVENPLQIPAYDYPREYGPRPPSFARATLTQNPEQRAVFISGTAAVRGHATMEPDSTLGQLTCTLENLRELSRICSLGSDLGAGQDWIRHFKIYLRDPADHPAVAAYLERHLIRPKDQFSYVHADICRSPLSVEIEATLFNGSR